MTQPPVRPNDPAKPLAVAPACVQTGPCPQPTSVPRGEGRTKGFWVCERCGPC